MSRLGSAPQVEGKAGRVKRRSKTNRLTIFLRRDKQLEFEVKIMGAIL
jgi:hypothetical protein